MVVSVFSPSRAPCAARHLLGTLTCVTSRAEFEVLPARWTGWLASQWGQRSLQAVIVFGLFGALLLVFGARLFTGHPALYATLFWGYVTLTSLGVVYLFSATPRGPALVARVGAQRVALTTEPADLPAWALAREYPAARVLFRSASQYVEGLGLSSLELEYLQGLAPNFDGTVSELVETARSLADLDRSWPPTC